MSLLKSVEDASTTVLRALLSQYKRNPKQIDLEEADIYGNTPLLKACYLGRRKHVELLLHVGANLNAINYLGQNALTLATYCGSLDVVRLLLRFRSYTDFNKSSIVPALCVACLRQNKTLINYFKRFPSSEEELKTAHGRHDTSSD
ncbi:DNA replication inhibitor plutonium isoform X2 [Zeugodacus cucurbitae]|uniref:DNA replication inhibitor plutonium isoform X2 n=1 Tax=Zeugodacus cucurbitae TaxID=28588 RepID=UPI0005967DC0|nr:DNA replication inhibitor plutonium isoform X2 [Zeugodacus cucurbitae]